MKEIIKTYKNEQSYLNYQGYIRLTHNQVRPNKETTKFTKIKTSSIYTSLLQEMQDKNEYEYICAGLNSFEREVVVIDSDDTSSGKDTLSKLLEDELVPHCQKIKSNGHSQTYFFIEPFYIGSAGFTNGKYWEKDNLVNHEQWKRLTKMINYLYAGDICYTGYNCQNPLYKNANVVSYKNVSKLYTVQELYEHCLSKFANIENLDYYLKYLRAQSLLLKPKHQEKIEQLTKVIIKFKETDSKSIKSNDSIITNEQLSEVAEKVLDDSDEILTSINQRIFVITCQVAKSFKMHNALDWNHFDEIARTAYKNFTLQDYAKDYTCQCLINRIRADVRQIIFKDMYNQMEWSKVGYTDEQRKISIMKRKENKENRKIIIIYSYDSIITNEQLSDFQKAKIILAQWNIHHSNDKLNISTIRRYLKEIKEEQKKKESLSNQSYDSIITNEQLDIENLVSLALEINNTNYNIGEQENGDFSKREEISLLSN